MNDLSCEFLETLKMGPIRSCKNSCSQGDIRKDIRYLFSIIQPSSFIFDLTIHIYFFQWSNFAIKIDIRIDIVSFCVVFNVIVELLRFWERWGLLRPRKIFVRHIVFGEVGGHTAPSMSSVRVPNTPDVFSPFQDKGFKALLQSVFSRSQSSKTRSDDKNSFVLFLILHN